MTAPLDAEQQACVDRARTAANALAGNEDTISAYDRARLLAIIDQLTVPAERPPSGGVVYVDTETTGLDPDRHEIWEVALIDPAGIAGGTVTEKVWQLPVDLGRADPVALQISHYHDRHGRHGEQVAMLGNFARDFARHTRGKHLVGAVVSFDAERLSKLLRAHGALPEWHYHLIDVEALAVGFLARMGPVIETPPGVEWDPSYLPWSSSDLTRALGLAVPDDGEKHTALGDARWAGRIYERVMDLDVVPAEIVDDNPGVAAAAGHYVETARLLMPDDRWVCATCRHPASDHRPGMDWTTTFGPGSTGKCGDCVDCEPF